MRKDHLSPEQIDKLVSDDRSDSEALAHLSSCELCRAAVAAQARIHARLSSPGADRLALAEATHKLEIPPLAASMDMEFRPHAERELESLEQTYPSQSLRRRDARPPQARALARLERDAAAVSRMPQRLGRIRVSVTHDTVAVIESSAGMPAARGGGSRVRNRRFPATSRSDPRTTSSLIPRPLGTDGRSIELLDQDVVCSLWYGHRGRIGINILDRWTETLIGCSARYIDQDGRCREGMSDDRGSVLVDTGERPGRLDVSTEIRTWIVEVTVD